MSTKVVVRHFHEGNDADRIIRSAALYATNARIVDLDTGNTLVNQSAAHGPVFVEVWAYCSPRDTPSRKHGRDIAIGRLQKQFPEECAEADFGVFKNLRNQKE